MRKGSTVRLETNARRPLPAWLGLALIALGVLCPAVALAQANLVEIKPNLPPMKLDIKPLPARPPKAVHVAPVPVKRAIPAGRSRKRG